MAVISPKGQKEIIVTTNHNPGDLTLGSGSGHYTRGDLINDMGQMKEGTLIIDDCKQFDATNVARVASVPAWSTHGYGVTYVYVEFRDPTDVRRFRNGGSGPVCIWDFELAHRTYYLAIPKDGS